MKKQIIGLLLVLALGGIAQAQGPNGYGVNPTEPDHLKATSSQPRVAVQPMACVNIARNLRLGMSGDDVAEIQRLLGMLGIYNHPQGVAYGYYGKLTVAGITKLQEMYAGEVLTPNGLVRGNGYAGPSTRALLRRLACGPIVSDGPVISGVSGPSTLNVNQPGTWTVSASSRNNGSLSYRVIWGDEERPSGQSSAMPVETPFVQTATFTHSYASSATYAPIFVVRDNASGKESRTSLTVRVGIDTPAVSIQVTSPNGGERWEMGDSETIRWRGTSSARYNIYLDRMIGCSGSPCPAVESQNYPLASGVVGNSWSWEVGEQLDWSSNNSPVAQIYAGTAYRVRVCRVGVGCDSSDRDFTIVD
jgi:peptidoglycan hydrolase-like protein with peptidoglycan-binding domain